MRSTQSTPDGRSPRVRGRPAGEDGQLFSVGSIPAGAGETVLDDEHGAMEQVDPRGCGGDDSRLRAFFRVSGRSPRVRGRPGHHRATTHPGGSIPAGAGETREWHIVLARIVVDPRGCGGDSSSMAAATTSQGRSPRVRGRHAGSGPPRTQSRSIPAGAGETADPPATESWKRVDPRGCGGDFLCSRASLGAWGRSPRVRGRLPHELRALPQWGSIPAGAGETAAKTAFSQSGAVDPRGCGGDLFNRGDIEEARGRSPRVRGRLIKDNAGPDRRRSIPAGAGETLDATSRRRTKGVDPRGCGGDKTLKSLASFTPGRSPRVRGRRGGRKAFRHVDRSIPAGAGETPATTRAPAPLAVDPRGCGGDSRLEGLSDGDVGRSPRVRGRRLDGGEHGHEDRSIPAGAGETVALTSGCAPFKVDPRGCGGDQ